jgi:hypothetical protein
MSAFARKGGVISRASALSLWTNSEREHLRSGFVTWGKYVYLQAKIPIYLNLPKLQVAGSKPVRRLA